MLHKVDKKYVDDVTSMVKVYVDTFYQDWIEQAVRDSYADGGDCLFEYKFDWGLRVSAKVKMLPDNTPEKSSDGKHVFESFGVGGDRMLCFLAFCFQEGELRPRSYLQTDENRERYGYDAPSITISKELNDSGDISLSEWCAYIRNKYQIIPPKSNRAFDELITGLVSITGGIASSGYDHQIALVASSESDDIYSLGLSTKRRMGCLHSTGITKITTLIRYYKSGLLLHLRGVNDGVLREIEEKLAARGVPKVHQEYHLRGKKWGYSEVHKWISGELEGSK